METAEKLARFVAQVGPEIEQFSIENSTDNPDLWYVAVVPFEFECLPHECPERPRDGPADTLLPQEAPEKSWLHFCQAQGCEGGASA